MRGNLFTALLAGILISSTTMHGYAASAKAKFLLTPTTETQYYLANEETATVQYTVLNQTKLTRTLTMVPIAEISQITTGSNVCANPFTLQPNESCLLTLAVGTSQFGAGIYGGPKVCKTYGAGNNSPDPFLCSQPEKAHQLAISRRASNITRELSASPSFLSLPINGASGQITVTNHSYLVTATNIAADFSRTALNGNVTQDASNCTTLAPQQSCTLIFTSLNQAVSRSSFPIKGADTRAIGAAIEVTSSLAAPIRVTGSPLVLQTNGVGTLTITNTSTTIPAHTITANLTGALATAGVTVTDNTCATVLPGASCTMTFQAANTTVPLTDFIIQGTDTSQDAASIAVNAAVSQATLAITAGSPMTLTAAGSNSATQTMTIQNTSSTIVANNITVPFFPSPLAGAVELVYNTCATLAPGQSCQLGFQANTTQAATTQFGIEGGNTTTVIGTITVNPINYAYIGNETPNNIMKCTIDNGAINAATCAAAAQMSGAVAAIVLNASNTYLYSANNGITLSVCPITQVTGSLACQLSGPTLRGNIQGLAINSTNTLLYLGISPAEILKCTIINNGSAIDSCVNSGATGLSEVARIVLNPAGTRMYVVSRTTIYQCPVDAADDLGACVDTGVTAPANNTARSIALTSDNLYAYISGTNAVTGCTINQSNGNLESCQTLDVASGLIGNGNDIKLDSTNTLAYIATRSITNPYVGQCSVNAGVVSSCQVLVQAYPNGGRGNSVSVGLLQQ